MLKVGELVAFMRLDRDGFDRDMDQSESRFSGMGKKIGGVAAATGAAAAAAIGAAAVKGVGEFTNLERGMNEVFTLMPGMSERAMGAMTDDVRGLASEMGAMPNEVVPALYSAISAGVPPDNVFGFLETANKAAVGGVTDLNTAVDGISSVVNAYGDDVIDAGQASDQMFTAVRLGKTNFEELSGSLFNVLPTASALGVEFGDVTAAIATMTAQGTPTSVATTQMRQAFVELSKDGGQVSDTFQELTGKSFKDFIAEGGNTADALMILSEHAEDTGIGINDLFGSVEAGSAALALTSGDAADFRSNIEEMGDAAGATEGAYDQMDQGIGRSMDKLKAQGAVLLGELGERIAPALTAIADWVMEHMPKILEVIGWVFDGVSAVVNSVFLPAFQLIQDIVERAVSFATGIFSGFESDTSSTLGSIASTAGEIFGRIREIIDVAMAAIQSVIDVVLPVIRGIWENNLERIISFVTTAWENIQQVIDGAMNVIKGILDVVLGIITGDWSRAWEGIRSILSGVWNMIKGIVRQAWNVVSTVVTVGLSALSSIWSSLWEGIRGALANAWENIKTAVSEGASNVWSTARALPGRILSALARLPRQMMQVGRDMMRGLIDGIKNMAKNVANAARDAVKGAIDGAKNFLRIGSPSKVFREMGHDIGDGLSYGMADAERQVVKAAEDMARAAVADVPAPEFAGVASGQAGGYDGAGQGGEAHYHYHLSTSTSRSDADIEQQFRRMEILA